MGTFRMCCLSCSTDEEEDLDDPRVGRIGRDKERKNRKGEWESEGSEGEKEYEDDDFSKCQYKQSGSSTCIERASSSSFLPHAISFSLSLSSLSLLLVYPSLVNESEAASGDEDGRDEHGVGLLPGGRRRKTDKDDDLWTPQGKETVCIYIYVCV